MTMKVYQLQRTQFLPISAEEAWDFFSSPRNLAKITPAHMRFNILGLSGGEKMYAGQIIRYKINVLPYVPVFWTTEITHVDQPNYFVDDQRFGPFALWHHQHSFKAVPGGIQMTDEVHYAVPLGFFGRLANWLFVEKEVNRIFNHRFKILEDFFKANNVELKKIA
jgi:ligand-binding SRPBCC domain-containing protein